MKTYKHINILKVKNKSKYTIIDWQLGNYCNFKCSYCFDGSNSGTHRVPKLNDTIKSNIQHLVNECRRKGSDKIFFSLAGGEPTMYHDFSELSEFLKTLGKLGLITNGSRTEKWWITNRDKIDEVAISHHMEFSDPDHTIKIIETLLDHVILTINVMVHDEKFKESLSFYKLLKDRYLSRKVSVRLRLLRNTSNRIIMYPKSYKEDLDTVLNPNQVTTFNGSLKGKTSIYLEDGTSTTFKPTFLSDLRGSWKGYRCSAPFKFIQIGASGNIGKMSCGQRWSSDISLYSDDFTSKFKFLEQAPICTKIQCGCIGLLLADKEIVMENMERSGIQQLLDTYETSELKLETSMVLSHFGTNSGWIRQFQGPYDSIDFYLMVLEWYINEYGGMPSEIGPGKNVKLLWI